MSKASNPAEYVALNSITVYRSKKGHELLHDERGNLKLVAGIVNVNNSNTNKMDIIWITAGQNRARKAPTYDQ